MKNRKFGENYLFSHPKTEAQIQLSESHAIVTRSHLEAVNKYLNSLPDKEKAKIGQGMSFLDSNGTPWPMRGERVKVGDDEGIYSHFDVTRCRCVVTFPGGFTERLDPSDLNLINEIKSPEDALNHYSEKICLDEIQKWWDSIQKTRRSRNMGPSQKCLAKKYFDTNPESLGISHIAFIWMQTKRVAHHQV